MRWQILLGAAAAAGISGCAIEASPSRGALSMTWRFGGQDCQGAEVSTVAVQLFDTTGAQLENDSFPCSQGSATYTGIALGDYTYQLAGFSSDGARRYTSTGTLSVKSDINDYDLNLSIPP